MSMNNVIIIKEFPIKGEFTDCDTPTIFGIFDVCIECYDSLEISDADEIIPDLRTAIQHAQHLEAEYGLHFILIDEE